MIRVFCIWIYHFWYFSCAASAASVICTIVPNRATYCVGYVFCQSRCVKTKLGYMNASTEKEGNSKTCYGPASLNRLARYQAQRKDKKKRQQKMEEEKKKTLTMLLDNAGSTMRQAPPPLSRHQRLAILWHALHTSTS